MRAKARNSKTHSGISAYSSIGKQVMRGWCVGGAGSPVPCYGRKWVQRFDAAKEAGLLNRSRCPLRPPNGRTTATTPAFMKRLLEERRFPVQLVQTDRSLGFFPLPVSQSLRDQCITLRPIKPASPHMNGDVARAQKIDREKLCAVADPNSPELSLRLAERHHYDNEDQSHILFKPIQRTTLLSRNSALLHRSLLQN